MIHRRDFYRLGTFTLGGLLGLGLAVPGVAYVLSPLLRKREAVGPDEGFLALARLGDLAVGVPQSFPILNEHQDAWVRYPREPIGQVWLIRQPDGASPPVIAFTGECPHLGCSVNLAPDGKRFVCPCHTSAFEVKDGRPLNSIPPRGMDRLDVKLAEGGEIRVKFQRFRTQTERRIPLA